MYYINVHDLRVDRMKYLHVKKICQWSIYSCKKRNDIIIITVCEAPFWTKECHRPNTKNTAVVVIFFSKLLWCFFHAKKNKREFRFRSRPSNTQSHSIHSFTRRRREIKTFSQVGPKMCSSLAKLYNRATVNDDWKVLQELKVVVMP